MTLRPLFAALLLLAPTLAAQTAAETAPQKLRVHIIGASVSGGFRDGPLFGAKQQGDSVTLQQVLKRWAGDDAKVTTHTPMEMWNLFREPDEIGQKEIAMAKRAAPDAVLAVDFLFWFAYGYVRGEEREARQALLDRGFALLEQLGDVPIVIGDLPDMTGAATRMLNPRQIPSAAVLQALNERIAKFAAAHAKVTVVPMAKLVAQLKTDGAALPLAGGALATPPGALLQEDRLHATRLGMALLGYSLQEALRGVFPEGHALRARQWTFEQFVDAAGALGELEALQGPAAAPTGTGK